MSRSVFAKDMKGTCFAHATRQDDCEACRWAARARGIGNLADAYLAMMQEQSKAISALLNGDQLEAMNALKRCANATPWAEQAIEELKALP